MNDEFWEYLQRLTDNCQIVIDRPKGSTHPRFQDNRYPVNYGLLNGTTTIDSGGVDVWVGSLGKKRVVGALCTVDLFKKDTELKILYDCIEEEIISIVNFVNNDQMRAIYIKKEGR
jgi:inorganic pyrophosphatase